MKNKAYTLIELVIVMGIITIFTGAMGLSLSNYNEKNDYKEITEKLYTNFETIAIEADNKDIQIDVKFDYNNSLILFEKEGNIISKINLPKRYTYTNNGGANIHFTETGNVSPMFTLIVKENGNDFFKLTFISTDKFVERVSISKYLYKDSVWEKIQ